MTICASSIINCFFVRCITLNLFCSLFSCFQGKPMGAVSVFMTGNCFRQSAAASLFFNLVDLSFLMKVKSDVMKNISFDKMSESFATVEVLVERTFFATFFSPLIYFLMENQECSMFLLELFVN